MKKVIGIFLLLLVSVAHAQKDFPQVQLKNLEGENVSTSTLNEKDQVYVVSLWATWCVPCVNELDAIKELYPDWQDETGVKLIAISTDDTRTSRRVQPMVSGRGWDYEILLDANQDLKRTLNISTIPHVLIIKNGKIRYRHSGYTPGGEYELYEKIQEIANE